MLLPYLVWLALIKNVPWWLSLNQKGSILLQYKWKSSRCNCYSVGRPLEHTMSLPFLWYPGQQFVKLAEKLIWMKWCFKNAVFTSGSFRQEGRSYSFNEKKTTVTKTSIISYLSGEEECETKTITRVLCIISFSETHHPKVTSFWANC